MLIIVLNINHNTISNVTVKYRRQVIAKNPYFCPANKTENKYL